MANISTLGQALDQISRLKTQQTKLDTLTTQIATGKKTQSFSGLGTDVLYSKRARADIKSLETYITNITNSDRRIKLMLNSVKDIQDQARNVLNSINVAVQEGDYPDLETIQDLANNIYEFIVDVMNTQDGDRYLFAGGDSGTRPVTDTGLFSAFMGEFVPDESDLTNPPLTASGVIGQWGDGTITTDQFIAAYHSINETILGYSNALSNDVAGSVKVRVDDNSEFDYTVLADVPGMKEILTVIGVLRSLPPVEHAPGALNDPTATTFAEDTPPFPPEAKQENFFRVINDLSSMLNRAIDSLDQESFKLAQVQAQISMVKKSHQGQINTLKSIVSDVEDIDVTEAAVKVNQLQIQLEVSFQVTAVVAQLSLSRFI